jgi:starch phosphorylase
LIEKGASALAIEESSEALNPEALTIGFARRFTAYKRGDLIFTDIQRLMEILNNSQHPVQLILAGKAHPQDHAGKEIIQNIIHHINTHNLLKKVIFIEDYDMNVARYMLQGVDVWLNNPLRPHEASGTSGMKASVNGVLNLSVRDGWWDEAYDNSNGWAIGSGETYKESERNYQDDLESKDIYSILENTIVPMFYEREPNGLPLQWIKMMKNAFVSIVSYFNTHRMVKEYYDNFYREAGSNYSTLSKDNFNQTRELVAWKDRISKEFHNIKIEKINIDEAKVYKLRDKIKIEVEVFLGNLNPEEINVDIYYGNIAADNRLNHSSIKNLKEVVSVNDGRYIFSGFLTCQKTGNFGLKIRITPSHPLIIDPYEMNLVTWK